MDMIVMLKQQLGDAQAREQAALEREKIARNWEELLLTMLQDMQHRNDRLLDAPRSTPLSHPRPERQPAVSRPAVPGGDPRGDMRQRIVALLQDHPEGLTPAEMRDLLGVERSLADTCLGMLRYGLVQRVG
jgi:hypothetical protein